MFKTCHPRGVRLCVRFWPEHGFRHGLRFFGVCGPCLSVIVAPVFRMRYSWTHFVCCRNAGFRHLLSMPLNQFYDDLHQSTTDIRFTTLVPVNFLIYIKHLKTTLLDMGGRNVAMTEAFFAEMTSLFAMHGLAGNHDWEPCSEALTV